MTEPLLPPRPDDQGIAAAYPGRGAPGTESVVEGGQPATPEEIEAFNKRMDDERDNGPRFHAPLPDDVARP
ncbi:hypothetical protein GM1_067_00050 [Gordonia malaquae NBRC 108250]|uniref:Uncharacterized protein n=1 Tax=Gordonia malaquae NBRC 108250 TaxID=1223542 RepID=M3VCI6_GORML|nr:hypothetical protein GM1_067_00050 [Gordonia malaquae NBRC 108250]